jgi:hypothetical protein
MKSRGTKHPGVSTLITVWSLAVVGTVGGQTADTRSVVPVLQLGAVSGVPGFSNSKWGPLVGVQLGFRRASRLSWTVEGDYVFVRSASRCCGPPGGFTFDDHGILGVAGLDYRLGGDRVGVALSTGIGVASFRETRRGSVPGFIPAPDHRWQFSGIVNAGIELSTTTERGVSFTAAVREYLGLTGARVGAFNAQPALVLGIGWAKP